MRTEERTATTGTAPFPAPTAGWVQSGNLATAKPNQAEVLDNFIPTAQGARLRGGSQEYADLGAGVVRLFNYASGSSQDLLGSTAAAVFDVDRVNAGSNAFAELEGLSSGDWSTVQMSTSAGQFLLMANGSDFMHYWDGTIFEPITDEAIFDLPFDAESAAFTVGETVSGGTSGASATIHAITKTSATEGVLKLGAITSGPFQDNEALTDGASGAATAAGASAAGSTIALSGVASETISQIWSFKRRIFGIEGGTTSAWYWAVDSIGGTITEINLGPLMRKGGALLFGATWSLDSGDGLDDVCVFVTTQGEVIVYEGTDPASANTWSLVGVYEIGEPLNKHASFKAGGDLAILTEDGIVSVAEALKKDRAALQAAAISYPIEDAWKEAIANRTTSYPISATLWQAQTLLLVGTPATVKGQNVAFAANARTGAWGRILGWDVRCSAVSDDVLYVGQNDGLVLIVDAGGNDNGTAYTGTYVPKFQTMENMAGAISAQLSYRADEQADFTMYAHADYIVDDMPVPTPATTSGASTWGTGVWGTFIWGGENLQAFTEWQGVAANGYALAPSVRISSNQDSLVRFEIIMSRLRYETGYAL